MFTLGGCKINKPNLSSNTSSTTKSSQEQSSSIPQQSNSLETSRIPI